MAGERVSPTQIRFPPEILERLKQSAASSGTTVHAAIVDRIERSLAEDERDPEVEAIRAAALAMLYASHLGVSDLLAGRFVLEQFKANMTMLFDALNVGEVAENELTKAAASKVIAEMRSGGATPLAEAGRVLGLKGDKQ